MLSFNRASMNNSKPRSKTGLIDRELNYMIIVSYF